MRKPEPQPLPPLAALRWADRDKVLSLPELELEALMGQPGFPNWLLHEARTHPRARIRAAVAKHPGCRHDTMADLAADRRSSVRALAAASPLLRGPALARLAGDLAAAVRRAVAANPNLNEAEFLRLSTDSDARVRATAARRPWLRYWSPNALAGDEEALVRREVAGNIGAPRELLQALSRDRDGGVRLRVARHPYTPWPALRSLFEDPEPEVRAAALTAAKRRERQLLTLRGETLWKGLVARYGLPIELQQWPSWLVGTVFATVTTSDGYGSGDVHFREASPEDLSPDVDRSYGTRYVFAFPETILIPDWISRVGDPLWERLGDVPDLLRP